jgi:hypothetical protein
MGVLVALLAAVKIVSDEKGRTEFFVKPLDNRIAEVDVRVNDVSVVGFEPRNISRTDCAAFAGNNEREPSTPSPERFGKYGVKQGLPVDVLFDEIGNPDRPRPYLSFHGWIPLSSEHHSRGLYFRPIGGKARSTGIMRMAAFLQRITRTAVGKRPHLIANDQYRS